MRVYAISDLHTDYEANMEWVRSLSSSLYQPHTLIVAGDVANSLETFTTTMRILKEKFQHVFFVAGNHDLWCKSIEDNDVSNIRPSVRPSVFWPKFCCFVAIFPFYTLTSLL